MNEKKSNLFYGWFVFVGLMLIMLVCGTSNTAALFYTPASQELGVSLTAFALTATITMVTMAVSIPFVTQIYNRVDIRIFLSIVMAALAAAYYANSVASSIWVFYITSVVFGLFVGFMSMMIVPIIINSWFAVKASTLIGICSSTLALGGAVLSAVGGWLIQNQGWRFCYKIWALITVVVGIPVSVLLMRKSPAELGQKPYGYGKSEPSEAVQETGAVLRGISLNQARKMPAFYIMAAVIVMISASNVFYPFINSYLLGQGISTTVAGTANSVLMVGGILGYIVIGVICDKSPKLGLIACIGASILAYPVLTMFGTSVPLIMSSCFLIGITYQPSLGVMGPALANRIFGPKDFSGIWSIMATCISVAGAITSTVWAAVIELAGYSGGMICTAVLYAIVLVLCLMLLRMGKTFEKTLWNTDK